MRSAGYKNLWCTNDSRHFYSICGISWDSQATGEYHWLHFIDVKTQSSEGRNNFPKDISGRVNKNSRLQNIIQRTAPCIAHCDLPESNGTGRRGQDSNQISLVILGNTLVMCLSIFLGEWFVSFVSERQSDEMTSLWNRTSTGNCTTFPKPPSLLLWWKK